MLGKKKVAEVETRKLNIIGDAGGRNSDSGRIDIPKSEVSLADHVVNLYSEGVYKRITSERDLLREELEVYRAEEKAKEEALAEVERKKEMVRKSKLHLKTLHVHGKFQGADLLEIKCHEVETDREGGVTLFIKYRVSGDDIVATIPSKIIDAIVKK